ncbi:hypothetical protein DM02DRAFT_632917 [Periconia macrospinosa]|uniref:Uncharacterized protein n=1 Tax=Periconia macrospinosa TaxID=97972 RepID=A0A2V1DBE0_9PLEO|nr:hypothetical protein DM02DRAFT_632917 [Periconia macrospinosa]
MLTKSDSITIAVTLVVFVFLVLFLCICCFRHDCYCPCDCYDDEPYPPEKPIRNRENAPTPPMDTTHNHHHEHTHHHHHRHDDTIDAEPGQTGWSGAGRGRSGSIDVVTPLGGAEVPHHHNPPPQRDRRNSEFDVVTRLEGGILRGSHNHSGRRRTPSTSQVAFQAGSDTFDAVIPEDRTSGGEDSGFDVASDRERAITRPGRAAVRGGRGRGRGRG